MRDRYQIPVCLMAAMVLLFSPVLMTGEQRTDPAASGASADGWLDFINPNGTRIVTIQIEIADTPHARARGLMGRTELPEKAGMLFVFKDAGERVFWMRNTLIPLDMMFVSASGRIINIAKMTRPMSDTRYHSNGPAQYVVETAAGFCDRFGISEGTRIRWRRR